MKNLQILFLFLILPFINIGEMNSQVYTHDGTVKLTRTNTSNPADKVVAIDRNGIITKTTFLVSGLGGLAPTGLESITENSKTGWRLIGEPATNYGDIGINSVTLSTSSSSSSIYGATSTNAFTTGRNTTASAPYSFATGTSGVASGASSFVSGLGSTVSGQNAAGFGRYNSVLGENGFSYGETNTSTGESAFAGGRSVQARSFAEFSIGTFETAYSASSTTTWNINDRIFNVGIGSSEGTRANGLTIFKSGHSIFGGTIRTKGYTVATLPSGTEGDVAYVTDATTPTYLGTLIGGGAIKCPVFYNGSAWVSH